MIMDSIKQLRYELEQQKGHKARIQQDLKTARKNRKEAKKEYLHHEKAQEVVKEVGLKTQQELEYHISNLVSAAISSVFPDNPYQFKVQFVQRRSKTECDLLLEKDGELIHPLSATGGGVVDIISFALRIAALSMQQGKIRPLLLMDEPFKHLSTDLQERAGLMLKELAENIGIQILYISHSNEAIEGCDKCFKATNKQGMSQVEVIQK